MAAAKTTGGGGRGERENDGGGRFAGPGGPQPFNPGPLPGWDDVFDEMGVPKIVKDAVFPADGWDPALRVDNIALKFAAGTAWPAATDPGLPPGQVALGADQPAKDAAFERLAEDVQALLLLKQPKLDPLRRKEIIYQAGDILPYFMKLASCSGEVRPNTHMLLVLCMRVAAIVSRHHKKTYMRPRPVQVIPSLDTVIPTPRHPSYPSGHALQAHLMAKAVSAVKKTMEPRAQVLAARIAINREYAGVHFRQDSVASKTAAEKTWTELFNLEEVKTLVEKAAEEHPGELVELPDKRVKDLQKAASAAEKESKAFYEKMESTFALPKGRARQALAQLIGKTR